MGAYILRRLMMLPVTVILLSTFVFFMIRLVPGSVVDQRLPDGGNVEARAELEKHFGLDKPDHVQYFVWLGQVVRGDLGKSWITNQSIVSNIKQRFPVTLELLILTMLIYIPLGIGSGVYCAVRQNHPDEYVVRFISILGLAIPNFWLATLAIILPLLWWHYSPPVPFTTFTEDPFRNLRIMLPAALVSSVGGAALLSRMTRSEMLEVLRQDYVRTARAKGLGPRIVVLRHALRNALPPLVTIIGLAFAGGVAGSVITEQVFGIPGMGNYLVTALLGNDLPIVQTWMLLFGTVFVLTNLMVDVSYAVLDPRIRY